MTKNWEQRGKLAYFLTIKFENWGPAARIMEAATREGYIEAENVKGVYGDR